MIRGSVPATIPGQRRLLALDGGGIRGMIAIEILASIERALQDRLNEPDLVLADWFDYVGGTSTGAIIATLLSLGKSVSEIRDFYRASGAIMFDRARILERFWYKFHSERLAQTLREIIGTDAQGADETLGTSKLKTLLLVVMRDATTDSPWPLSNNPAAKYNVRKSLEPGRRSNLELPLWQLVRASTAAPTYFPPEIIDIDPGLPPHLFVDGGVTTYNNPGFLLFLMSTLQAYHLQWETGEKKMLLVSVGTGSSAAANANLMPGQMNLLFNAEKIPAALMYASLVQQDLLCRVLGQCRFGAPLDRELGDLCDPGTAAARGPKLFTYCRYDPELSRAALDTLGLPDISVGDVAMMDSVAHIDELARLGVAYAAASFHPNHLADFLPGGLA